MNNPIKSYFFYRKNKFKMVKYLETYWEIIGFEAGKILIEAHLNGLRLIVPYKKLELID